jgi:hypothetical protein
MARAVTSKIRKLDFKTAEHHTSQKEPVFPAKYTTNIVRFASFASICLLFTGKRLK